MIKPQSADNQKGFTLIEIAIVMVIIGLLAGGGVSLMGALSERKIRNESFEYMEDAKNSLINYAKIHGRLPWADRDGDGNEDTGRSAGTLPYLTLNFRPTDANKRVIRYAINSSTGTDRALSCSALRSGLSGAPLVVDSDGSPSPFPVAAIIISAGPKDADGDGNVFDDVTSGTYTGDNRDGNPNYLRFPPTEIFDDIVVYVSGYTLYGEICGEPAVTVNNRNSSNVYVYDRTEGSDIGMITPGNAVTYRIVSGDQIEFWTSSGGAGSRFTSSPANPFIASGPGLAVDVPP